VLDGIPFGSAGGVMGNGHCEPKAVAELALPAAPVAICAIALPLTGDAVGGEGCRVMRDAYEDRAAAGEQVIDAVWDGNADGIGTEIVTIGELEGFSYSMICVRLCGPCKKAQFPSCSASA